MALSRDFFPNDYHCLGDNENRPIKWMAMESLTRREFSTASDIVSLIPVQIFKEKSQILIIFFYNSGLLVWFFGKSQHWLSSHTLKLILSKSAEYFGMDIDLHSQSIVLMNCKILFKHL